MHPATFSHHTHAHIRNPVRDVAPDRKIILSGSTKDIKRLFPCARPEFRQQETDEEESGNDEIALGRRREPNALLRCCRPRVLCIKPAFQRACRCGETE